MEECDIARMCWDLKELLEDICTFLSNGNLRKLSPKDQKLAESLINRSKKQLQKISRVQPPPQSNEEYVIMNKQGIDNEKESDAEPSDIYSSVDDISTMNRSEMILDANIYKDLPAKDACPFFKSGWLSMKKKFILGFEKMKRVYGTIHNSWLLIYLSEKDLKPTYTFNLKHFVAKESNGEKNNFTLLSTKPNDNKVYHFMALTHKDKLQWMTKINLCQDMENIMENSNINYQGKYPNTAENNYSDNDSDGIYEILTTTHKHPVSPVVSGTNEILHTFPKLSKSRLRPSPINVKDPVAVPPPLVKSKSETTNSSESMVSYQEIFTVPLSTKSNNNSTKSLEDSFSDNSGDEMYETFVCAKQSRNSSRRNSFEDQKNPKVLRKPK
ncbi:uncharacterized protein LOC130451012 [Diorhabda sublineata]|uniref:uncharacterized protein LOC130451012 n=1 Tax=Diorhabda sublineata TaxID=1163346 RepID=UPI0024E076FE|nr:uncharacterized protein LOC130451012 [Diorhabda sublineata]